MKYLISCFCLAFCLFVAQGAFATEVMERDSIGIERVNGKIYVLHKIERGQTMYSLVRRYKTTLKAIKDANPGIDEQLKFEQVVKVPYELPVGGAKSVASTSPPQSAATPAKTEEKKSLSGTGLHKVESGQTLYSIAIKYGVLMADIRKWNSLASDNVPLGETLIVSEKAFLEKNAGGSVASVQVSSDSVKVKSAVPEKVVRPVAESIPAKSLAGKPISESGLAEVIETNESSSKFLALHRSAPIGTLIHVRNVYNQEEIYVKVVGRIPETSANEDILIKLSLRAFERISPNTKRFRAELNYKLAN
jgi:LysM repeat protein